MHQFVKVVWFLWKWAEPFELFRVLFRVFFFLNGGFARNRKTSPKKEKDTYQIDKVLNCDLIFFIISLQCISKENNLNVIDNRFLKSNILNQILY